MEQQAFTGGVRPGGLTKSYQVNILICHILAQSGASMTFAQLAEMAMGDELVNYFEFAGALGQLTKGGQVELVQGRDGEERYALSPQGRASAAAFSRELPLTVRERAEKKARTALLRERREKEILTSIEKVEDGYRLTLRMTDIGSDLLDISVFLPTQEKCEEVRKRFMNDPMFVYQSILALLTGEAAAGEPEPNGEAVF